MAPSTWKDLTNGGKGKMARNARLDQAVEAEPYPSQDEPTRTRRGRAWPSQVVSKSEIGKTKRPEPSPRFFRIHKYIGFLGFCRCFTINLTATDNEMPPDIFFEQPFRMQLQAQSSNAEQLPVYPSLEAQEWARAAISSATAALGLARATTSSTREAQDNV